MQNTMTTTDEVKVITNISSNLKREWEIAADIEGLTLTDFVIKAANDAMGKIFSDHDIIPLSVRDQIQVAEELIAPPKPLNETMQNTLREYYSYMDEAAKDALQEHLNSTRGT
jgi:uncharacterized protein (DUF1778 family)